MSSCTHRVFFTLQVVQGDWPSDVADDLETAHVLGRDG